MACLGSSLAEVLTVVERVQAAGGRFLSVSDGIDLDAETGRLALRVLVALTFALE
jgi:DNA invertase Pin-like site-specific DNA recombinase